MGKLIDFKVKILFFSYYVESFAFEVFLHRKIRPHGGIWKVSTTIYIAEITSCQTE